MTLTELLAERKLAKALILDDAYDTVPRAEDLSDDAAWSVFMDDVRSEEDKLVSVFPRYEELSSDELRQSDEFVAALWGLRESLSPGTWKPLFESYEQGVGNDRKFLETLETELGKLGLTLITSGRTVPAEGKDASIIFADLFLGASQVDPDMERSLGRIDELLRDRREAPPIVILMSRSELLKDKKAYFRDRAGLLGAMFRVYSKSDLADGVTLPRTLERLATYYPDALRVAAFIHAWDEGLNSAARRFMGVIRRLDLPDYAQIRQILLEFEGQPLGSYVMDVFDRVLQHEIEADADTIRAAASLNDIDTSQYPAPYVAGSSDLQELAYRSIWQHPKRLAVKATESGAPVSFGDVLVARSLLEPTAQHIPSDSDALVVLTASCDLVRSGGAKRMVLMAGAVANLDPAAWTYKDSGLRTPIVVLPDSRRMWIKWNAKDVQALLPAEISALVSDAGTYRVTCRLREAHALELQQHLLADMGRVGVLAQMPATFHVRVQVSTVTVEGGLNALDTSVLARDGGVCYTGRDARGDVNTRLLLTEDAADELALAISNIDEAAVHTKARGTLERLRSSSFLSDLQRGLNVPDTQGWSKIKAIREGVLVDVGLIARDPEAPVPNPKHLQQLGAIVILLNDDAREPMIPPPAVEQAPVPQSQDELPPT